MQGLRVLTSQLRKGLPVNQNMVRRDVVLLSPLGAAVSKSVWFCFFGEARGFRFLGILRRQPKVHSSTSLSTPGASHASSPPQKVGFSGHYCMAGLLRAKSVGHHLINFVS
jgi:hypothetical protein